MIKEKHFLCLNVALRFTNMDFFLNYTAFKSKIRIISDLLTNRVTKTHVTDIKTHVGT